MVYLSFVKNNGGFSQVLFDLRLLYINVDIKLLLFIIFFQEVRENEENLPLKAMRPSSEVDVLELSSEFEVCLLQYYYQLRYLNNLVIQLLIVAVLSSFVPDCFCFNNNFLWLLFNMPVHIAGHMPIWYSSNPESSPIFPYCLSYICVIYIIAAYGFNKVFPSEFISR